MIEPYLMFIQGINMPQIFIALRPQHYTEIFNHTKYYPKTQPAEKNLKLVREKNDPSSGSLAVGEFHVTMAVVVSRSAEYSSLAGPTQDEKDGG